MYSVRQNMMYFHDGSFVDVRWRFLWMLVPKAGSQSITKVFRESCPYGRFVFDLPGRDVVFEDEREFLSYFKFCFVRNPYTRVLSFYMDKVFNYRATEPQQKMFARYQTLKPFCSMPEFLAFLRSPEGADDNADPHFLSQHRYVLDKSGRKVADMILHFENFKSEWANACKNIGLDEETLGHLNRNDDAAGRARPMQSPSQYADLLTPDVVDAIRHRYARDFEVLGYDINDFGIGAAQP